MTDADAADGVTIVRFDHPPVNALDLDLLEVIVASMRNVEGPVVITGADRCFSAGVDLRALVDGGAEYAERFVSALSEAFLAVFDHPAPVVAAINGHAIAGGCVFAMCADVRLMSAGTIGLTELAVGVPFPVAALEICRFAMGTSVTRAALQANTIDADTASAQGWVDAVVPNAELIPQAVATARELGQYSPAAYAATKRQLHRPARTLIDAGITPSSVGRERTLADAAPRSTGPRLSTEELQRAREYLARPETQQYLRAREVLHTRTPQPRAAVVIEAHHVATVFRELSGERGSRSVPTPPTTMRVPSTKRVMEAAVAVANGEAGAANRLGVTAPRRVAQSPQQVHGHGAGHGRA